MKRQRVRGWSGVFGLLGTRATGLSILLVAAVIAVLVWQMAPTAEARKPYQVPQDPAMESSLGIRIKQIAVVGDGGLVEVRYTVLDGQKASRFQNNTHHPPVLRSERRSGDVYRTALMKQGHQLRPGQTYYILYLNNHNTVRSGESVEVTAGNTHLRHVPVR
ncbi:hypothetical protein [Actinophytocola sp.]|uniref:hypothetical protein n=1 Tax=Actinophytocola sp. TaxID=1872138 RepID=UPI002ED9BAEA